MQILLTIIIFFKILTYIIFFDVILSWLSIFGLKIRPQFVANIIDPIYNTVKKILPTSIGPIDFTPIVVIISIIFIEGLLYILFPDLLIQVTNLLN